MAILTLFVSVAGIIIFLFGLQSILFIPMTLQYEVWKRRFFRRWGGEHRPRVSVIVPAYNEEQTIVPSVESIIRSDYSPFEVIVVNDGSTDSTEERLRPFIDSHTVVYVKKCNGGKGSALNEGLRHARGDVVLYTDADSLFGPSTIRNIARWFVDPGIHAVCGNDTPLRPETSLQKLLTLTTHIGTGFVRRAFSVMRVVPIVSGNTGAVRRLWLEKVNGFSEACGEDLDMTFRLQRAGARIVYDSEALVTCDVPRSFAALWKQRVRWTRSYIRVSAAHADMVLARRYFPFSWYLPVNWFNMVGIALLQSMTLLASPFLAGAGVFGSSGVAELLSFLGYVMFGVLVVYSTLLDRAPGDLRFLPLYGWLIIPVSYFYDAVVLYSLYCEARGVAERWEKIERRDLRAAPVLHARRIGTAFEIGLPVAVICGIGFLLFTHDRDALRPEPRPEAGDRPALVVATHVDSWPKPEDAVSSVLRRDQAGIVNTVAIGAGRCEWTFFRWNGHEQNWSNDQRKYPGDILADAVRRVRGTGRGVVAIVDFYAPLLLQQHPEVAARGIDGTPSPEQVCFTELVRGEYGKHLNEMITYLAKNYDLEGISLTELAYNRYCYDDRCRADYSAAAGSDDWPRTFWTNSPDRSSTSVGRWRSQRMAGFLREIADSVHRYGKKLYVDVPVQYGNLRGEGLQSGLHYPELAAFADGLVVWDYFSLEGRSPRTSEQVARFFVSRYGADKVTVSIGLWGKDAPVSPDELGEAVSCSILGGAKRVWITPNHLLTDSDWGVLVMTLAGRSGKVMSGTGYRWRNE